MSENNTIIRSDVCIKEAELAEMRQKIEHIKETEDKFEKTLEKLDNTQDELSKSIASLNSTFNTLKWLIGVLIALFGGIGCFLITELIKLI